jgi:hypothetical protein
MPYVLRYPILKLPVKKLVYHIITALYGDPA